MYSTSLKHRNDFYTGPRSVSLIVATVTEQGHTVATINIAIGKTVLNSYLLRFPPCNQHSSSIHVAGAVVTR